MQSFAELVKEFFIATKKKQRNWENFSEEILLGAVQGRHCA
jgi:hypothetical protein